MRRVIIFIAFTAFYLTTVIVLSEHIDWYTSAYAWVGFIVGTGWSIAIDLLFPPSNEKALENEIASLKGYIEDLVDEDCPKEYKGVVKEVVFGSKG
jgi:hypothetical protein